MLDDRDEIDRQLLDAYQHDFPLTPAPFARIGNDLGLPSSEILTRYRRLLREGLITRIGVVLAPNSLGASTLAAMTVPPEDLKRVAARVSADPAVSHNYARESDKPGHPNLWFVVTTGDAAALDAALTRIEAVAGLTVRDLRLLEPFHLDLGFSLEERGAKAKRRTRGPDLAVIESLDRSLAAAMEDGLPLVDRPFLALGQGLGLTEAKVLSRLETLKRAHVVRRLGVIVRHRKLGYRANAMCVWNVEDDTLTSTIGRQLAGEAGVTLCYRRRRAADWPYNIYCMVHARSREEARPVIARLDTVVGPAAEDRAVLFSTRCFKQTGARLSPTGRIAA